MQPVQAIALGAPLKPGALGMRDAAPGGHPVHLARTDGGEGAEAVAVLDFAVEQIGDGREPDMRMRAHVDAHAGLEFGRAHVIDEDEGADHAPLRRRQRAPHFEGAEIGRARHDHALDGVALEGVAGFGILAWEKAHGVF